MSTLLTPVGANDWAYTTGPLSGTLPIPFSTGTNPGDLVIAVVDSRPPVGTGIASPTFPAGWTIRNTATAAATSAGTSGALRRQTIATGLAVGTDVTIAWASATGQAGHCISLQGSDNVLHSLSNLAHNFTTLAALLTAPDPAPGAQATLLCFGMNVHAAALLGFTQLWDTNYITGGWASNGGGLLSSCYYKTVPGGPTAMPFDTKQYGIWHSCWVTPPVLPGQTVLIPSGSIFLSASDHSLLAT